MGEPTSPNQPARIATGGPAGAGDAYLLLTSGPQPGGPGSRLAVNNDTQWGGNFLAAGIGRIEMDVNNLGATDLYLRLLIEQENPMGPPFNAAFTTNAVVVAAGSGWRHVGFNISPASLTALLGTVNLALMNATELRLFHNPAPSFNGPPNSSPAITARLGIDNIAAVPEPASLWLAGLGMAGLIGARMRRR